MNYQIQSNNGDTDQNESGCIHQTASTEGSGTRLCVFCVFPDWFQLFQSSRVNLNLMECVNCQTLSKLNKQNDPNQGGCSGRRATKKPFQLTDELDLMKRVLPNTIEVEQTKLP